MKIKLEAWGEYACFTRPEFNSERMSYDIPTPSAMRGLLESIYWKPEIRWVIQEIHVLSPIKWANVRRNEVSNKATARPMYVEDQRQQRNTLLLRDVRYGVVAHFDVLPSHKDGHHESENTPEKHFSMFTRRAGRGQHFQQPYLGCREFIAHYDLAQDGFSPCLLSESDRNRDLGWMFYDLNWPKRTPMAFHAKMVNGVVVIPDVRRLA